MEQKELFEKENKRMKEKDYKVGKIDNIIKNTTNVAEGVAYILTVIYSVTCISKWTNVSWGFNRFYSVYR